MPIACHTVWLIVKTQRFKCQNTECFNHTFVGKLAFADSHAKRANRLNDLIERTIVQSSSVLTSKLLETQGIQIKKSAICNLLKKTSIIDYKQIRHVGIDDFAICRRQAYATIMVDLDTHQIIDLFPSRDEDQVANWLSCFPNLEIIVRDGARFFSNAIDLSHPQAIQVSDRFHFIKTVTRYFKRALFQILPAKINIPKKASPEFQNQPLSAEKAAKQFSSWKRKQPLIQDARKLATQGFTLVQIGQQLKLDPRTVKKYLNPKFSPRPQPSPKAITRFKNRIRELRSQGFQLQHIYKTIVSEGYPRQFRTFASQWKEVLVEYTNSSIISRKNIIQLLFKRYGSCTFSTTIKQLLQLYPEVRTLLTLFFDFVEISRNFDLVGLDNWLSKAKSFRNSAIDLAIKAILRDYEAIQNPIIFREYSNGPVEGKNTRLKLIKRGMFGRNQFDILRRKMLLSETF